MILKKQRKISILLMSIFIAGQIAVIGTFLLAPKPAEAFWGVGDLTFDTQIANWYDVFKDIGLGIAERLAINYANKYLQKFVDKVVDKYRIKNYLYYQKVLSGYYLNQYIYDKVADPDLRAVYGILSTDITSRATVTDPKTGQEKPVMVALREKIDNLYNNRGGINPNFVYNPSSTVTDQQYFRQVQAYFASPPDFSRQDVYSEFARLKAQSDAAAGQEVGQSGGLKSDRSTPAGVIPHVCDTTGSFTPPEEEGSTPNEGSGDNGGAMLPITNFLVHTGLVSEAHAADGDPTIQVPTNINTEEGCINSGGTWVVDKTGLAQSVIQNPSQLIHDFATSSIKNIFENNFGASDSIYTTIGSLLGDFIFTKLNIDKKSGVFNEKGDRGSNTIGASPTVRQIDLDGDNIPDGVDTDGDDKLDSIVDTCYHGGTPPNCKKSSQVTSSPYFTPICTSIDNGVTSLADFLDFITTHSDEISTSSNFIGVVKDRFKDPADADLWGRRISLANSGIDNIINQIQNYHAKFLDNLEITMGRYAHYMSTMTQSIQHDQDLAFNKFGNGAGGLKNLINYTSQMVQYLKDIKTQIGKCSKPNLAAVNNVQAPTPPIDPGDDGTGAPAPDPDLKKHPSRQDIVQAVKQSLTDAGVQFQTDCEVAEIPKRVAWELNNEGLGVFKKTVGENICDGISVKRVIYPDGYMYKILIDGGGGGANTPEWASEGCGPVDGDGTCPDLYLQATDPGPLPGQ